MPRRSQGTRSRGLARRLLTFVEPPSKIQLKDTGQPETSGIDSWLDRYQIQLSEFFEAAFNRPLPQSSVQRSCFRRWPACPTAWVCPVCKLEQHQSCGRCQAALLNLGPSPRSCAGAHAPALCCLGGRPRPRLRGTNEGGTVGTCGSIAGAASPSAHRSSSAARRYFLLPERKTSGKFGGGLRVQCRMVERLRPRSSAV